MHAPTILDGPMGTELLARGVATPLPGWSAHAIESDPDVVAAIHHDYAQAGATVHTANTFRTQPRRFAESWRTLLHQAVDLARRGTAGFGGRIAGSISPLEDCYRPDLSPLDPRPGHRLIANALADAGVDLLLVETFPHLGEAQVAIEEAIATGLPTWVAFTAGPSADLLTVEEIRKGAEHAVSVGVAAVLVNCVPTQRMSEFLEPLRNLPVPFGAYGNAGAADDDVGFTTDAIDAIRYADFAKEWVAAGASIVGSCCGTGIEHVAELGRRFPPR
jgi:S-methylmethionine-dependent homocysteine/selenocysteine methylase